MTQMKSKTKKKSENSDAFIKRLSELLTVPAQVIAPYTQKLTDFTDYKEKVKMEIHDYNKLVSYIEKAKILIEPYSHMGFRPAYILYRVDGDPLFEYEKVEILRFHSDQLPKTKTHDNFSMIFLSNRNIELGKLVKVNIKPNADYYY